MNFTTFYCERVIFYHHYISSNELHIKNTSKLILYYFVEILNVNRFLLGKLEVNLTSSIGRIFFHNNFLESIKHFKTKRFYFLFCNSSCFFVIELEETLLSDDININRLYIWDILQVVINLFGATCTTNAL